MRPSTPKNRLAAALRCALVGAVLAFTAGTVLAQDPIPTAADPDMAEQETYGLVVKVSGSNFGTDSEVDFLVNGSETDTGGITVRNVRRRNPKTLEVTIDVAPDAQFLKKFDIRVRSNGRTGKGTELFRVLEKPTGGGADTTPPAEVDDLEVVALPALQPEGDYQATFRWTSPFDDRGGIDRAELKARPMATPLTVDNWEDHMPHWTSRVDWWDSPVAPSGTVQTIELRGLAPDTCFSVAVRVSDPALNWSGLSNPLEICTGPAAPSPWDRERIDGCDFTTGTWAVGPPMLDVSADFGLAAVYQDHCNDPSSDGPRFATREGSTWTVSTLPTTEFVTAARDPETGYPLYLYRQFRPGESQLVLWQWTGTGWASESLEPDTKTGFVTDASAAFVPDPASGGSRLALAYRMVTKGKRYSIRLALRDGGSWEKHDLTPTDLSGGIRMVSDDLGQVGIVFAEDQGGNYTLRSSHFALWDGAAWLPPERIAGDAAWHCDDASVGWNPSTRDFWAAVNCWKTSDLSHWAPQVQVCRRSNDPTPVWSCEEVVTYPSYGASSLEFADDGTAYLVTFGYSNGGHAPQSMLDLWSRATSVPGSTWSVETVDWDVAISAASLRIDPATQGPLLLYFAPRYPEPSMFFAWREP